MCPAGPPPPTNPRCLRRSVLAATRCTVLGLGVFLERRRAAAAPHMTAAPNSRLRNPDRIHHKTTPASSAASPSSASGGPISICSTRPCTVRTPRLWLKNTSLQGAAVGRTQRRPSPWPDGAVHAVCHALHGGQKGGRRTGLQTSQDELSNALNGCCCCISWPASTPGYQQRGFTAVLMGDRCCGTARSSRRRVPQSKTSS